MKFLLLLVMFMNVSWANLHLAPPDFDSSFGRVVFVDFTYARYDLTYDLNWETASVRSKIIFEVKKKGRPLFDLVPNPRNVYLQGQKVNSQLITLPDGNSKARIIDKELEPGIYVLELENVLTKNVRFHSGFRSVSSAFWIRDLKDRMFLEQYVPSNLEFDQYKIILNVKVEGASNSNQEIFTNGEVTKLSGNNWKIEFPDYFTVSCPFFHMTPKGSMVRADFNYTSVSGRVFPMTIYSPWRYRTRSFKTEAIRVMQELENDYGPWAHPSFVAYGTFVGTGGMEHAGATATSFGALDHEMLHSYFAKGVMPANGNSGWIDEAIASWRDRGYPSYPLPGFIGGSISGHSVYRRNTDVLSYVQGSSFMGYLDYKLQNTGGLKAFLKGYFQTYKHTLVTTEHFKNNIEFFSGLDFTKEFNQYIWGKGPQEKTVVQENPFHPELTEQDLNDML